ncbi:MAG TPA: hypothetical protein PLN23_09730, partial [Fervidobacterium sp.]|nr:hypothetical protein [Fervidobacterium sp.]
PSVESHIDGKPFPIFFRYFSPLFSCLEKMKYSFKNETIIIAFSSSLTSITRKEWFYESKLLICKKLSIGHKKEKLVLTSPVYLYFLVCKQNLASAYEYSIRWVQHLLDEYIQTQGV